MAYRRTVRIQMNGLVGDPRLGADQQEYDQANGASAASGVAIPHRMIDALTRAALTVEEGHRLHDVVSRIRSQERFLPFPRVPLRVAISRTIAATEAPKPLVFDTVRVGKDKLLGGQDECPICLLPYEENNKGTLLPCRHGFHEQCIQEWTKDHPTCPICRLHLS